jgi:hypothetical protein
MFRIFKIKAIIILLLIFFHEAYGGSFSSNQYQNNPIKIIQSIYGFFPALESIGQWHKVKLIVDQTNIPYSSIFKKQYDLLMSKHNIDQDGGPCIDVNLVCNCQDGVPEFYRISPIGSLSRNFIKYQVDLKGNDFSLRQIFWSFNKIRGSWFIEDIGFSSPKDSILRYMRGCLSSRQHSNFSGEVIKNSLPRDH